MSTTTTQTKPLHPWQGVIRQYASFLPVTEDTPIVSINEGNTPLIPAPNFVEAIGGKFDLFLKFEGLNPTASFKDRGMTVAMSKAKEKGAEIVVCASTGNTSASAAAYAARAGMKCVVLIPHGNIAQGKLAQALMHGAITLAINGSFDKALSLVRELGETGQIEIVNSINPHRLEGQKTASFEICDSLGDAPDFHFLPVGNAGNITAYWKGYKEYQEAERSDTLPRMFGCQAAGAAPIVDGRPVEKPETIASAIRIGNPASWETARNAIIESNGQIEKVTDEEIMAAYTLIARKDGLFVEPASAAALASVTRAVAAGLIPEGSLVAAVMTGHGLKDPDVAIQAAGFSPIVVEPTREAIMNAIGL